MGHAFAAADLVVTRAGMGTLTELAALGKPAVVVPIPESHQEENARFFADSGAALYFEEKRGGEALAEEVGALLADTARMMRLTGFAHGLNDAGAAKRLAGVITDHVTS
jgi:UDP-N-acetylglucosamine--N-acetylmuramyl-(pentapeptide) pyrophosphoryl-undecaprenol N-acetylglucosamine transferase